MTTSKPKRQSKPNRAKPAAKRQVKPEPVRSPEYTADQHWLDNTQNLPGDDSNPLQGRPF
jgi:hypothetical protein